MSNAQDIIIPCNCEDHDTDGAGFATAEGCPKHDLFVNWKVLRKVQRAMRSGEQSFTPGEDDLVADHIEIAERELSEEWGISAQALRAKEGGR